MKALEIYEQDMKDREQGVALPRQQYYAALRDALHRELMQQGWSELLEKMLLDVRGGMDRIYMLDYAALMECHSMVVLDRQMRDAQEYVPYLQLRGEKATWAAVEIAGNSLMPVSHDFPEKLRQLRSVSRQLVDARDNTVIPQADDAARREIDQVHLLNKMLEERCRALQDERDALQARLRQAEEGVITEQLRYAIEARRIQEEEALRTHYAQQREAAREAYRSQFAQELSDGDRRRAEAAWSESDVRETVAAEYAVVRQSIGEDLRQLTGVIEKQMEKWQQRLDRSECRMLAQSYAALYDLFSGEMTRLVLAAQEEGGDDALRNGLAGVRTQLGDRLQQLEQAMLRLGLLAIHPQEGEAFNPALHLRAGVTAGDRIIRCVRPGVILQGAQEALLKAAVELG